MRIVRYALACLLAAPCLAVTDFAAHAQTAAATQSDTQNVSDAFHEIETKYIFGFVDGSDIGNQGEKAVEYEMTGSFQKRGGRYSAVEHELEFEQVPTQFFAYELSAHGISHSISGVEGLDDLNRSAFGGLSAKLKYLVIGRGPGSPFGVSISAEPEWSRIDGTDGTQTRAYSTDFRLAIDTELISNRLYAALNLNYEPELAKPSDSPDWEHSSGAGLSLALAYRVTPKVTLGAAAEYDRAYDGLTFQTFYGHALFVGPTLHVQIAPKVLLAAAFAGQVAGHAVDDPRPMDLTNFERYRANLKFEVEF